MAVKNNGNALVQLGTLFNVGAIGSLWAQDSLAPWLHQALYRAAARDRSATIRHRSHEHAAAASRPESVAPPHHANADDLEKIIHQEIERLPGRFRVAVVLCDLEGRNHERAAGVLISMFLSKVKLVMTAAAVVAALAAGAVALAQSGIGRPKDRTGKPLHVGPPSWTDHILVSRNGEPPRKVAVVETTGDTPVRVDVPGALILFQPKRDQNTANPSGANSSRSENDQEHRKIVLTSPKAMDVAITQRYVCQIRSRQHIDVCALENGCLDEIKVREGQAVKKGDLLFKIAPTLNNAKLDDLFANIRAPFEGIIGRLREKQGSLIKEGDILTTLSDNNVMWVFFNVPEKQYLEYMANRKEYEDKIELVLASQTKFPQPGKLGAIEGQFNNATGNVAFRADFPNPDGLLHHGQTGTIVVHRKAHDAIVIPLRATYEMYEQAIRLRRRQR